MLTSTSHQPARVGWSLPPAAMANQLFMSSAI